MPTRSSGRRLTRPVRTSKQPVIGSPIKKRIHSSTKPSSNGQKTYQLLTSRRTVHSLKTTRRTINALKSTSTKLLAVSNDLNDDEIKPEIAAKSYRKYGSTSAMMKSIETPTPRRSIRSLKTTSGTSNNDSTSTNSERSIRDLKATSIKPVIQKNMGTSDDQISPEKAAKSLEKYSSTPRIKKSIKTKMPTRSILSLKTTSNSGYVNNLRSSNSGRSMDTLRVTRNKHVVDKSKNGSDDETPSDTTTKSDRKHSTVSPIKEPIRAQISTRSMRSLKVDSTTSSSNSFVNDSKSSKGSRPVDNLKATSVKLRRVDKNYRDVNNDEQPPPGMSSTSHRSLKVNEITGALPCREEEYVNIYEFISSKLLDKCGGCIYVSGVPGTGKTATIYSVVQELRQGVKINQIPKFKFIEINGMRLTEPSQSYVEILKQLTGEKAAAERSANILNAYFNSIQHQKCATIILIDELDLLWTRKQHVMYNLFDWPNARYSRLIVLAVANTMDLPERTMINRVSSRLGLTRLTFQPYSFNQLERIIRARIANLEELFSPDAIQFVARKVAAVSGDVRRTLDICRRAVEIGNVNRQSNNNNSDDTTCFKVEMKHVATAISEMFASPKIAAIRNLSLHEQFFLRGVVASFRLSGVEEATFQEVYEQYVSICRTEGIMVCSAPEIIRLCQRLGTCKLLIIEPGRPHLYQRIRLNVSQDDVMYAVQA